MARTGSRGNHDSNLALGRMFFKVGDEGGGGVAEILLEGFCEFARDADGAEGASDIECGECFEDSVRGLEVNAGLASFSSGGEFIGTAATFDRQESAEKKPVAREAGTHEGCEHGRWPWEHADSESAFDASADEPVAGVGNARHSSIRDEGDMGSASYPVCDILAPKGFVVSVQAEEGLFYAKVLQKQSTVPGILGSDEVSGFENFNGAKGNILPIADRCGNDA